jgi:hypothetical protein
VVAGTSGGKALVWNAQSGQLLETLKISPKSIIGFNALEKNHIDQQFVSGDVFRCMYERRSGMVGTMTTAGIALWGSPLHGGVQSKGPVDGNCEGK